ncbi:hypothetical protein QPI28_004462 [Vibrio parahaemolyticus]|nr:hypothetical protein [Vibrio parahaemolyticus]ELA7176858.1 hypothetical protein [Vibrio parahaemolyticus]ELA7459347.1 hypothetical protein [Vibrio parahaemolyticus]ELA7483310.1 hypothetical protein [Vibrio parahaemolyticus]ELA7905850.1 hypothetical protein [Vibrio parahaemolyticus]
MEISWLEIFSIVSSLVSLIIGGFAIWLSVQFYKMSVKSSEKLERSSSDISSATQRLETLFDKLYSDTFSMVKDTMNDMRQHVWNSDSVKDKEDDRLKTLKEELTKEFNSELATKLKGSNINDIELKVEELVARAIKKSVAFGNTQESERIIAAIRTLASTKRRITLNGLCDLLNEAEESLVGHLFDLKHNGVIDWKGDGLGETTPIVLVE